jgi:hypothetical protein
MNQPEQLQSTKKKHFNMPKDIWHALNLPQQKDTVDSESAVAQLDTTWGSPPFLVHQKPLGGAGPDKSGFITIVVGHMSKLLGVKIPWL